MLIMIASSRPGAHLTRSEGSDTESLGCHCLVIRSDVRHLTGEFQIYDDVSRETSNVE